MTRMPGSGGRTGLTPERPGYVVRFTATERLVHWIHAAAFLGLLATGLVLYVPELSIWVARRNLVKNVHIWVAVAWAAALVLVVLLGNRRALARTWREVEAIDGDDLRWLLGRRARQGRFNAGQKLNLLLTAAFAILFAVSGLFLWLGERDHRFLLEGAIVVHDTLTLVSVIVVMGHLYLAVIHPATRHALRGMTVGDVREDWARTHHPKWTPGIDPPR